MTAGAGLPRRRPAAGDRGPQRRRSLLAQARAEAASIVATAQADADQLTAAAQAEADQVPASARAEADQVLAAAHAESARVHAELEQSRTGADRRARPAPQHGPLRGGRAPDRSRPRSARLEQLERDHRDRMRTYLTQQLAQLDAPAGD